MEPEINGNRWYDQNPELAKCLDSMKSMDSAIRDVFLRDLLKLIKNQRPELMLESNSLNFPLDIIRRRWYDQDPYLWYVMNTLQLGDRSLWDAVVSIFKRKPVLG